jgi:predicted RecB family nuclease
MEVLEQDLVLSASDLINFLECEHLTALDLQKAQGQLNAEEKRPDTADLVTRKGIEHERAYLETLKDEFGGGLVEVRTASGPAGLTAAAQATEEAMRAGAPVIFQGTFMRDGWRGHADFLERVERPSRLGEWSYEVIDTKLAQSVKPYFIVQLCLYSELVAQLQGASPEKLHVVLGTGERKSFAFAEFAAYYRRIRGLFVAEVRTGLSDTYPDPVPHCSLCRWADLCDQRRDDDDHLSLVARMARPQIAKLNQAGIETVAQLATTATADRPSGIGQVTFDRLQQQARLQVHQRETGELACERLKPEIDGDGPPRGFARMPKPSEGDLFFDIEGDPFYDDGLEYLWGVTYLEGGTETFKPFWGKDHAEEKRAFEGFIDFVMERRERFPEMHVYHYAPYEPTAMKRLMGVHATREDEVDRLLRENVLVDLYRVVEQALRISQPSYSLKKVEAFYMEQRDAAVTDGEDSILMFEQWLDSGEQKLLDEIEAYNAEDCRSTLLLRDWLLDQRAHAEREHGVEIPWRTRGEAPAPDQQIEASEVVVALQERLLVGVSDDPEARDEDDHALWLMAQLLDYHRREAKPTWWEFFSRFDKSQQELTDQDAEALGSLEPVGEGRVLPPPKRSTIYALSFPAQEHKISEGLFTDPFTATTDAETGELDPFSAKSFNVVRVLDGEGLVEISRENKRSAEALPAALIPSTFYSTAEQQGALHDLARQILDQGVDSRGGFDAARAILRLELPATDAVERGSPLQAGNANLDETTRLATGLRESYLFVQGPPGSGKTYTGAQLILSLLDAGHRVGVAANSHKAINNLLHEVEKHAGARGVAFRGLQKHSGGDSVFESTLDEPLIGASGSPASFPTPRGVELMAGTAWLWCREVMRNSVDYLMIDEAGQVSLADALAIATAARNVILLGDPLQLAQVSQGAHPPGAGCSVLEHLLADESTIQRDRGVFLNHTRRMHPDVCRFVSEAVYEGRLEAIADCASQRVDAGGQVSGTGVRSIPLTHTGNTRQSPEEAERIADEIVGLVGAKYTKADGTETALAMEDLMVVTPYNAQVRCLRLALEARGLADLPVGTVDKFQGQEAAIVFFSMATSSGEDVPRNVEFLYSRNRLNVAISRARCIAVLVANPDLLTIRCRTVEQMRLVNALCLLVEMAGEQSALP